MITTISFLLPAKQCIQLTYLPPLCIFQSFWLVFTPLLVCTNVQKKKFTCNKWKNVEEILHRFRAKQMKIQSMHQKNTHTCAHTYLPKSLLEWCNITKCFIVSRNRNMFCFSDHVFILDWQNCHIFSTAILFLCPFAFYIFASRHL